MLIKSNFSFNIKLLIRLSDDEVFFELENLSSSFKKKPGDIGDDFRTMFDSLLLKIVVGILLFLVIFFHSTLCLWFLQFEKYGNDPMKRSVANLIVSQIFYGAALSNVVFSPFLTWRVIFGPIQPNLSGKCHFCLIIKLVSSASLQSLCFFSLFFLLSWYVSKMFCEIIHLLRFSDCLAHSNLTATFATDEKWPLCHLYISYQSLAGSPSSLQKSEFLKLIILIFHVKKLNN